jgi:hypothetical protein
LPLSANPCPSYITGEMHVAWTRKGTLRRTRKTWRRRRSNSALCLRLLIPFVHGLQGRLFGSVIDGRGG